MSKKLSVALQREMSVRMEELAEIADQLAPVLARQKQLTKELGELKTKIKDFANTNDLPDGTYTGINPRFEVRLGTRRTGVLEDIDAVTDPDLLEEIEVDHIIERDGKYYQLTGNTQAYNEKYKKLGLTADGWKDNVIRTISFTIDGKKV